MTTLFFREPRLFALALLTAIALGAAALLTIGRQEDPTITNIFATVITPFPGAAPDRVEAQVTDAIEARLRRVPEIDTITSTSATGISTIAIELSSFIAKDRIDTVWAEIRYEVAAAARSFPEGAGTPEVDTTRGGAFTAIVALVPRASVEAPPALMRRLAEELQDRLRRVPETRLVRLYGEPQEEILVSVDPDRLAARGLSPDAVSRAIAAADAKVRAGQLRGEGRDLLVEIRGAIEDVARVREIPLATGADGAVLRVGDVAEVRRATRSPPGSLALSDGVAGVLVAARMENDRQVDVWSRAVAEALDAFRAELPAGLEARLVFDQARYTSDRLSELSANLALGIAIVVGVLLVTLGWRSALVVAFTIPFAALVSIAILQRVGVPIHQMSVTGLIVALGLLVDAAIVTTDEIRRRIASGEGAQAAVGEAVRRLSVPLLASTVTTILAFVPMAALPGPAGDFVGAIAISVIVMLIASLVAALTLAPALAGWLLAGSAQRRGLLEGGVSLPALGRLFSASVALSLRHRLAAILVVGAIPVTGFLALPTLTAQFFPGVDRDQFYVQVELPAGAAIAETARAARAADALIRADGDVVGAHWVIGESAPSFYYNMQGDRDGSPGFAEALVFTRGPAATDRLVPALQRALDEALPQAQILVRGLVQGPPVGAPVELRLFGPDLAVLRDLGMEARRLLAELGPVVHTRASLDGGAPKLVLALDEDAAQLAGLDLGTAARRLESLLEGAIGGSLIEGTEEIPVRVRMGDGARADLDAIRGLALTLPAGGADGALAPGIPLAGLATLALEPAASPILRRDGERMNRVQAFLAHGVLPEEALRVLRARLDAGALPLPEGYRLAFGGDADARAETVRNLVSTLGLVVTLTIVTVVLTFLSFRLALVALLAAGLSFGASLLALALLDMPFGIQALIGAIGSIGVSINAALIVISAIREDEAARTGDVAAIAEVVVRASRHIVSTTLTTVGGFLPLVMAGGGFWPPFAVAIAGGVALSLPIALWLTPPLVAIALAPRGRRIAAPAVAIA